MTSDTYDADAELSDSELELAGRTYQTEWYHVEWDIEVWVSEVSRQTTNVADQEFKETKLTLKSATGEVDAISLDKLRECLVTGVMCPSGERAGVIAEVLRS